MKYIPLGSKVKITFVDETAICGTILDFEISVSKSYNVNLILLTDEDAISIFFCSIEKIELLI